MMSERQIKFRENYKSNISPLYNGPLHIGVMYVLGIGGLVFFVSRLHGATWEWLLVVPVFVLTNIFEWWIHKNVMHRLVDVYALRAIYQRHTREHHQYFTENEMTVDSNREFRIIFFPLRAIITFTVMTIPFALVVGWLWNANAGWILMITTIANYLIYETFHYCCHVHENRFVRGTPLINTIRRHHTAHHDQHIMMTRNFNLTFPIADWIFGTSDLNRGLLGHVFNGYSTRHVKPECAKPNQLTPYTPNYGGDVKAA